MGFADQLQELLEKEETDTVGTAFGGTQASKHKSFSVARVRDHIVQNAASLGDSRLERSVKRVHGTLSPGQFRIVVASLIRYSFLIELTNLKVGSTKMKTRWLPGSILMPQEGSFEPVQGTFKPGNDPRACSFEECAAVFVVACDILCDQVHNDPTVKDLIDALNRIRRVPYEFPLSYKDALASPIHAGENVLWARTDDLRWLLRARKVLAGAPADVKPVIQRLEKTKLQVKVFKTDRSLTGKDKTNRAKRWEVLADDFQHASLEQCWSAERKLTADLAAFFDFPQVLKDAFVEESLISRDTEPTLCPVTFERLSFQKLSEALLNPEHGVSQHQIGHLHPLKRGGEHDGENVCWQSGHGNRIQGDLSIEEALALLDNIAERRAARKGV